MPALTVTDPQRSMLLPGCFLRIEGGSQRGSVRLALIDRFVNPSGRPFLSLELDYETLAETLGGRCFAVKTDDACFALYPLADELRLVHQSDDWPFPSTWSVRLDALRSEAAALAGGAW